MKFEVVECGGAWIVRREGVEVGRFEQQDLALARVSDLLRHAGADQDGAASLSVRYERRTA
jgi:hypothetical protein